MFDSAFRLERWLEAADARPELGHGVRIVSFEADETISDEAGDPAPERAADLRGDYYGGGSDDGL